jgi:hypothetical protein
MRISTPSTGKIAEYFYIGFDTKTYVGDELFGVSFGRYYIGIYPTKNGIELAYGWLNNNGCLIDRW